jgi:ankyrin repeat protein
MSDIIGAVRRGDLDRVQALLKHNPGLVMSRNHCNLTPLHIAVFSRIEVAKLLLAAGAEVEAKDNDGCLGSA